MFQLATALTAPSDAPTLHPTLNTGLQAMPSAAPAWLCDDADAA